MFQLFNLTEFDKQKADMANLLRILGIITLFHDDAYRDALQPLLLGFHRDLEDRMIAYRKSAEGR